jgi:hypothetical protein
MEVSSARGKGQYLDASRLTPGEYVGMVSALVLLGSLWLPWYTTSDTNPNSVIADAGPGGSTDAWHIFETLDVLLVMASTAPFILAWIVMRGHKLTWKPGEVTMIVGMTAVVLILCNGIILGKPDDHETGNSVDIGLGLGWFVALAASVGLLVAGYLRQAIYTDAKKPPGVI